MRHHWRVLLVDQTGGPMLELAHAQVTTITWTLNHWGEAKYRLKVTDPQALLADRLLETEVQIWRDGVLMFWGIPVYFSADLTTVEFTAHGLLWYFATRFFGPAYSNAMPQLLNNGTFEKNPVTTGWQASAPAPIIAASTRRYSGSQAIRLTGPSGPNFYYIFQIPALPTPARTKPLKLTLSAWCYPEGITQYGPEDRGLEIQLNNGAQIVPQVWATLSANDPDRRWIRKEIQYDLPANNASTVSIALFGPTTGAVVWDQARLTYEQKTGALEGQDWVDDYLRRIVNYGAGNSTGGSTGPGGSVGDQNQWWGAPVKKSPLGMAFFPTTDAAGSLVTDMFWNHEDRGNIYEAMAEVAKRDKADFEVTWNATGTARGITPYVPRKGSVKRGLALELGRNITGLSYDKDGRQTANDVTVVGRNSGNTKEVGQAGGPTPTTLGGVQYEAVLPPPPEVGGQGLIDWAVTEERRRRAPVSVPTLKVKATGMLDTTQPGGPLTVGDIVPVRINRGIVQVNDLRRVVQITLDARRDELTLVTNVVV